jgi:hypothetical protein
VLGPSLLVRFLEIPGKPDKYGTAWQYHSRSDRHSKVGSWGVALDLLATSSLLRRHAVDAKACMTAHVKSLPRLYDELNSSHLCVHGASRQALAIGYVQVNSATEFVSPVINNRGAQNGVFEVTKHRPPSVTERVLTKIAEIPRRSSSSEVGFDGIGIIVLDLVNDGTPVRLVTDPPAPQPGDSFNYDSMIVRMANEYDTTFASI